MGRSHKSRKMPGGEKSKRRVRAADIRDFLPEQRPCATPGKISYATRAEAKEAVKSVRRIGSNGRLHAYRCPCGRYHVGSAVFKPSLRATSDA